MGIKIFDKYVYIIITIIIIINIKILYKKE